MSDASVDVVLSIFAHRSFAEFARVLRGSDLLICVQPGPDHLIELRRLLYADASLRRQRTRRRVARNGPLRRIADERLRYVTTLSSERDLLNLLVMTPFGTHASKSRRENVRSRGRIPLTIDFVITRFKAR